MAGTNDISANSMKENKDKPKRDTVAHMHDLVKQLKASTAPNAHIAICQITARKDKPDIMKDVGELNQQLRQVAQREQIGFVNTSHFLQRHTGKKGVHPNDDGLEIIYNTLEKYVRKVSHMWFYYDSFQIISENEPNYPSIINCSHSMVLCNEVSNPHTILANDSNINAITAINPSLYPVNPSSLDTSSTDTSTNQLINYPSNLNTNNAINSSTHPLTPNTSYWVEDVKLLKQKNPTNLTYKYKLNTEQI